MSAVKKLKKYVDWAGHEIYTDKVYNGRVWCYRCGEYVLPRIPTMHKNGRGTIYLDDFLSPSDNATILCLLEDWATDPEISCNIIYEDLQPPVIVGRLTFQEWVGISNVIAAEEQVEIGNKLRQAELASRS